ncbi:MAG: YsnF/AvaK domain-containing protein [Cyanobacteria bacterium P01_D01_bin.1]
MTNPTSGNAHDSLSIPMRSVEDSAPVESHDLGLVEAPVAARATVPETRAEVQAPAATAAVDIEENNSRPIQLYEERLVTQTQRVKTGEVKISKRVVTDSASADIPVTKEKIVIEIESIYTGETRIDIGEARAAEDGSVHMDIYEEQALSCRRIIPYQNVSVRKEVVADTVTAQEVLRREEVEIAAQGTPLVEERILKS